MKINAEILTDMGQYIVSPPDWEGLTLHQVLTDVKDALQAGACFDGETELLVIPHGAIVKHIRVYVEKGEPVVQPSERVGDPVQQDVARIGNETWNWTTDLLGQHIHVRMLVVNDHGAARTAIIPFVINDKPPHAVLRADKQRGLALQWLKVDTQAYRYPEVEILIPEADLANREAYIEYAEDFLEETRPKRKPSGEGAKAWEGWGAKTP